MTIKPFKLERYYTLHEFTAEYLLCSSDCEAISVRELLDLEAGAAEKLLDLNLGYTETKGAPELRRDISTIYQEITPEDLLVCSGAQEPIFLFSQAMLKAGDEVIVQSPCYQSLQSVPESLGCSVKEWKVRYKGATPTFDMDELEQMISPSTKIIYLNTPHNPTGFHFTASEQLAIVAMARKNNIIIFCDEVYRELERDLAYRIPAIADVYENGVSLGVMSKTYGLPGLRIGWLATKNQSILDKIAILKEYTTICNAGPSEFLAGVGLRNRQKLIDKNLQIVENNLPLLDTFFDKYTDLFSWHKPIAGPIAFVKMNFEEQDGLFAERVLKEKKVLLLPGDIYDYNGFFRIGFCRNNMPEALDKFEEFVVEHLV